MQIPLHGCAALQNIPIQHTIDTPYMVGPVHSYGGELGGDLALFDTGPPTRSGQAFLHERIDLRRLKHVFITHCHIDHYGLAAWLEKETDATIYLPYRDALKIRHHDDRLIKMIQMLREMGFDEQYLSELEESLGNNTIFPPFPEKYSIVEEGLPEHLGLEVLHCPGHSQSDLVYVGEHWAVTGDTLLRGIFQSPLLDVDLETGLRFNNYAAYCKSLVKLAGLSGKKILPGHRFTIDSVETALHFYIDKLLHRVEHLQGLLFRRSVAETVTALLGETTSEPVHIYLKASEIVFMQDFLERPEMLRDALEQIGLFVRVADQYHVVTESGGKNHV